MEEKVLQVELKQGAKSFLKFDKMITPKLIQILFYIGIIISGIIALVLFLSGGFGALLGLVVVLVGPIIVRVQCELLIIIFKIHEALEKISEK